MFSSFWWLLRIYLIPWFSSLFLAICNSVSLTLPAFSDSAISFPPLMPRPQLLRFSSFNSGLVSMNGTNAGALEGLSALSLTSKLNMPFSVKLNNKASRQSLTWFLFLPTKQLLKSTYFNFSESLRMSPKYLQTSTPYECPDSLISVIRAMSKFSAEITDLGKSVILSSLLSFPGMKKLWKLSYLSQPAQSSFLVSSKTFELFKLEFFVLYMYFKIHNLL